jgi:predicted O-methyltransferase YrrM
MTRARIRQGVGGIPRLPRLLIEALEDRPTQAHRPGHYYSPVPDFNEVLAARAHSSPGQRASLPGIDLRIEEQLGLLQSLARYQVELPDEPNPDWRYHSSNAFYAEADGAVLHAMLCHLRPERVVEIGSGFSSALMLDVAERELGGQTSFTFVDPNPGRLLSLLRPSDENRFRLLREQVQHVDPSVLDDLSVNDLLFIDSSHVTKAGSDVNWIYLELLPTLAPGVVVHVHDAFWPFDYPDAYLARRWAWNELYLLRAFLAFNSSFEIVLFPSYLEEFHRDELEAALPVALTHPLRWPTLRGASIWIRRKR